tara:strand:+ start:2857 stop:3414 length:558 start_codon:yes stop_codon:yes gene_type:complete
MVEEWMCKYSILKGYKNGNLAELLSDTTYTNFISFHDKINNDLNELGLYKEYQGLEMELDAVKSEFENVINEDVKEDLLEWSKGYMFKIVRHKDFPKIFPDFAEIKTIIDEKYNRDVHRMPNETSRKNLERDLSEKIVEHTSFDGFLSKEIDTNFNNLTYSQINNYSKMESVQMFNALFNFDFPI